MPSFHKCNFLLIISIYALKENKMNYIISIMPSLLSGAKMTLILFLWTLIISIPLGIIVSLGLISHFKILYLDYAWYAIVTTTNLYFLWTANHWHHFPTIQCCLIRFYLKLYCLLCRNIPWWFSVCACRPI